MTVVVVQTASAVAIKALRCTASLSRSTEIIRYYLSV
jgi:hypothetical protein